MGIEQARSQACVSGMAKSPWGSYGPKSESLFRLVCFYNYQNEMGKCVHKERMKCFVKAKAEINQTSGDISLATR